MCFFYILISLCVHYITYSYAVCNYISLRCRITYLKQNLRIFWNYNANSLTVYHQSSYYAAEVYPQYIKTLH